MAIRPILKLRFEQIGFNDFDYRVLEISGFPDEKILTSYKYNDRPRMYQEVGYDSEHERRNILVIDWGTTSGKRILKEGELCNIVRNTDLQNLKGEITLFVKGYNSTIEERDAKVQKVGYDTTLEFNNEENDEEGLRPA
ncbi:MAG: hypothetical protein WC319_15315 [Candidatus Paceibacterota bacterium]|jgi:hypothetical protein